MNNAVFCHFLAIIWIILVTSPINIKTKIIVMYIFVKLALSYAEDMIIHSEDMVSFLFHMLFHNKPQYFCIIYAQYRTNVNRYCAIHQDMLAISIDRSVAMCALAPNPCSSTITNVITSMCLQKSFHAPKISPRFGLFADDYDYRVLCAIMLSSYLQGKAIGRGLVSQVS